MILLDTHVLVWWLSGFENLSKSLLSLISEAREKDHLLVSSISFWEIAMLVKKRRLQLRFDTETWVEKAISTPGLSVVSPNPSILVSSVLLHEPFHPDPADRIIVATALKHGAMIMTADEKIRSYPHVESVWEDS